MRDLSGGGISGKNVVCGCGYHAIMVL